MFGQLFKHTNYKLLKINEINEINEIDEIDEMDEMDEMILKERVNRCAFCCSTKKNKEDTSFKTYQLDATMYKGKYLLTYEEWVKKNKG